MDQNRHVSFTRPSLFSHLAQSTDKFLKKEVEVTIRFGGEVCRFVCFLFGVVIASSRNMNLNLGAHLTRATAYLPKRPSSEAFDSRCFYNGVVGSWA